MVGLKWKLLPLWGVCLGITGPVQAVIVTGGTGTQNLTAPAGLTQQWANVGKIYGGSGVYLGNGWVLTAQHVGLGPISFDGVTSYNPVQGSAVRLRNPSDLSYTDLTLFKLATDPGLPALDLGWISTPSVGTPVTMIGFGRGRGANPVYYNATTSDGINWTWTLLPSATGATYSGYATTSVGVKSWATNTTVTTASVWAAPVPTKVRDAGFGPVTLFGTSLTTEGQGQVINGDSGGGVFDSSGKLIGIIDLIDQLQGQPADTVIYGQSSYFVNLATYMTQIKYTVGQAGVVPEPVALSLILPALAAMGRRRRV